MKYEPKCSDEEIQFHSKRIREILRGNKVEPIIQPIKEVEPEKKETVEAKDDSGFFWFGLDRIPIAHRQAMRNLWAVFGSTCSVRFSFRR